MKKLLFCYDGPLMKDENGMYYGSALNNELFSRYKIISDNINIAIRVNKILAKDATKKLMEISKEFNVFEVPNIKSIKGLLKINKFNRILKKEILNNDLIIVRLPSTVGSRAIHYCKKYKKQYLVEMVGCAWDGCWNHSFVGKIVAPFSFLETKLEVQDAKYVVYVSNKFLQERYPTHGKNINCSNVVLNKIENSCLDSRIRKIKKMKDEKKIIIGTIGGLNVKFKGQQYVIRAINKLKQMGYDVEYQLVGGGNQLYLENQIKKYKVEDSVKIIGQMKHEDIFNWIDTIDIYIQPSSQEGLCRSIIEAMSRACPIIASNAGGNSELINNKYIFKKKNVSQLVNRISNMTKSEMLIEAKNNYENSRLYQVDKLTKRRNSFLKEFLLNEE